MRGSTVMIRDLGGERSKLNNDDPHINRGVELLLRNRRRKSEKPKSFLIKFGKMISFFRREIHFYLEFSLDIKKK